MYLNSTWSIHGHKKKNKNKNTWSRRSLLCILVLHFCLSTFIAFTLRFKFTFMLLVLLHQFTIDNFSTVWRPLGVLTAKSIDLFLSVLRMEEVPIIQANKWLKFSAKSDTTKMQLYTKSSKTRLQIGKMAKYHYLITILSNIILCLLQHGSAREQYYLYK